VGLLLLAIYGYGRALRITGATPGEVRLAVFTLLVAAFVTLTVIGIAFRGPDMALVAPW